MSNLCRNRIPLCIEVLLCPHCEIASNTAATSESKEETTLNSHHHSHDVGAAHSNSYVLLEQWTIQQVHTRSDSKSQTIQDLCNAVRSHLCFSQLSAWLQVSQGVTPKHIFYRLTAPGEWFVHKFVMSPQSHKFPDAGLGRSRVALRVTLSSLPRTALTPFEISIASRDKLFAVKDASPLLRKSRSSFTNFDKASGDDACTDEDLRVVQSLTPNERTHTRSKSVRGLHDLTGRKSPPAACSSQRPYTAQRCLDYSSDDISTHTASAAPPLPASNQEGLSAAEKLASFSALPTNSINKLELISCSSGYSPMKAPPPNRLAITSQRRHISLKSPKVLFTRTSVYHKDNFFPIPSLDSTADLTSELSTDNESDIETDVISTPAAVRSKVLRPQFSFSDDEDENKESDLLSGVSRLKVNDSSRNKADPNITSGSTDDSADSARDLMSKLNSFISEARTSNLSSIQCDQTQINTSTQHLSSDFSTYNTSKVTVAEDISTTSNHIQNGSYDLTQSRGSQKLEDGNTQTDEDETSSPSEIQRPSRIKSRDRLSNDCSESQSKPITDTPINKKIQGVKQSPSHPLTTRSRLFKQRPLQSSPAPVKRIGKTNFGYDENLSNVKAIKSAISCTSLADHDGVSTNGERHSLTLSSSAPAFSTSKKTTPSQSHSSLLGNFEESLLNGRIDPAGVVEGFTVDIGASGSFCPKHVSLPVEAYFFNSLSDDDAPSPYLGYVDLSQVSRRGYQIPRKGTLQITLFYPNHKVNKMFVVTYDLMDMPARSQTFIRQKTVYAPCGEQTTPNTPNQQLLERQNSLEGGKKGRKLPTYLRYLIHLRFRSTKTNKIFLHTDIRLIYARDKFEFDSRVASYELRSFIESPSNPKYSPLK